MSKAIITLLHHSLSLSPSHTYTQYMLRQCANEKPIFLKSQKYILEECIYNMYIVFLKHKKNYSITKVVTLQQWLKIPIIYIFLIWTVQINYKQLYTVILNNMRIFWNKRKTKLKSCHILQEKAILHMITLHIVHCIINIPHIIGNIK